jgi:maltose phosphorylase
MGPDEFQVMVNNNCYTNLMAQRTFRYALGVLSEMDIHEPDKKQRLFQSLGCNGAELDRWREMADRMLIPYDAASKLYEQHEGFFDLPHVDVDAIPVTDFPLYHNWSYDRIYRNDMIKQPDVLMFMFLYNQSFSLEEKKANYEYYEPRCIHESSLSPSLHSILAIELGRKEEAFEFFNFATRIDLDDYNRNTNEGIHMTSIAAAWMNVVYGYGGMRSDGDELVFNPSIPAHWQGYSFKIVYRGSVLKVSVTQDSSRIELVEGAPVSVIVAGQRREIGRDGLVVQAA